MKKSDIQHLATLSRLSLTDEEIEMYSKDIPKILAFVDQLKSVKTDKEGRIENSSDRNVFREDEEPHESGLHTDAILKQAPKTRDGYVEVKKTLNN